MGYEICNLGLVGEDIAVAAHTDLAIALDSLFMAQLQVRNLSQVTQQYDRLGLLEV